MCIYLRQNNIKKDKIVGFLLLLFIIAVIQGCSSAGKDIHFRSRLPTQESPLISFDKESLFGFEMDAESSRYTFQPTNDLVTNYNLNNETSYFSSEGSVNGFDLSLNYRKAYEPIYFKGNLGLDFLELQINPSSIIGLTGPWFVNFNVGVYKTSAYVSTSSSSCNFICFSTDRATDQLKENEIKTSQSGSEKKIGGLIGYKFSEKNLLTISYQWMDYAVSASVSKNGMADLSLNERYYASGYGLGVFNELSLRSTLGLTVDYVQMHLRKKTDRQTVLGARMLVGF
ncbi:MAG: hypothetical protein L6Q37_05995 [Bdellovibrionaceae bacterium]|nr:hypothetical protein [Pseudobdellovibrionaceae bacterium]NUM58668.1 hypothetical protein [Pseudobdellovibrionaceae bacterium]